MLLSCTGRRQHAFVMSWTLSPCFCHVLDGVTMACCEARLKLPLPYLVYVITFGVFLVDKSKIDCILLFSSHSDSVGCNKRTMYS